MNIFKFIKKYHNKPLYLGVLILISLCTLLVNQPFTSKNDVSGNMINKENQPPDINNINQLKDAKLYTVLNVVDGDTIDVDINGKRERIRLIGINTPETVDPRRAVECFGKEASERAKELMLNKKVYLGDDSSQSNKDKYDRLLRYVYLEDGININYWLINNGYAYEYTYELPYKNQSYFKDAQSFAERNKLGLWAPNICN